MKNFCIYALLLTVFSGNAQDPAPRAFYKRCLVTSVTGGPSKVMFSTFDSDGNKVHSDIAIGRIDPIIMEYGITDKIGVGFSHGGENYNIDPNSFYHANVNTPYLMWTSTHYLTADLSYHPFVTKRLDVSVFAGLGYYNVTGDCYADVERFWDTPALYTYDAKGAIIRSGVRSRFYFSKRFGLMAMAYGFSGYAREKAKPNPVSDQKNNSGYSTMLTGGGMEFGICFRIFKQKGVTQQAQKSLKERWDERMSKGWRSKNAKVEEDEESDKKPLFRWVRD